MNFDLSEDQRAFQETARGFAAEQHGRPSREWDEQQIFSGGNMRRAAGLDSPRIYCREEHRRPGLSRLDAAIIFEELAAGCVSTAAYISIHNMASWMIDHSGRRRCGPLAAEADPMEHFASYCLTEPGAGSDAASLRTRAVRDGDHYVLNGTKAFISGGGVSDIYVVMVRTGGGGSQGHFGVVVEKGTPGL